MTGVGDLRGGQLHYWEIVCDRCPTVGKSVRVEGEGAYITERAYVVLASTRCAKRLAHDPRDPCEARCVKLWPASRCAWTP